MEETNKFVKNTMATKLHENDESFNNDEVDVFGDELVRWLRRGGTLQGGSGPTKWSILWTRGWSFSYRKPSP
jgi:hypothetical protein